MHSFNKDYIDRLLKKDKKELVDIILKLKKDIRDLRKPKDDLSISLLNDNRSTMFFNLSSYNNFRSHIIAKTLQGDIEFYLSRNSRGFFGICLKVNKDIAVESKKIDESQTQFMDIKERIINFVQ